MAFSPNQKYPGATDPNPNYKDGVFRDNSPATTNNGSPLKALDRNEQLSLQEAIMNAAGFNYNGIADTPQASQMFDAYKAALSNGANLLSNHNFLVQSPDDSQPPPDATPRTYPPGFQIFSGVFANETTGILNLTYIDGRVSFSGGDFYMSAPNSGGIERLTEFVASVADFDGKPRTRGVSYALVGDEYRITVGVDALEDISANPTPLGSVKFEQGGVATGHDAVSNASEIANAGDSQLAGGKIWPVEDRDTKVGDNPVSALFFTLSKQSEKRLYRAPSLITGTITAIGTVGDTVDITVDGNVVTLELIIGEWWVEGATSLKNRVYKFQLANDPVIEVYDPVGGNAMGASPDYWYDGGNFYVYKDSDYHAVTNDSTSNLAAGTYDVSGFELQTDQHLSGQGRLRTTIQSASGAVLSRSQTAETNDTSVSRVTLKGGGKATAGTIGLDLATPTGVTKSAIRNRLDNAAIRDAEVGIKSNSGWNNIFTSYRVTDCKTGYQCSESWLSGWGGSGNVSIGGYYAACDTAIDTTTQWNMCFINTIIEYCENSIYERGNNNTYINTWCEQNTKPIQILRGSVFINGRDLTFDLSNISTFEPLETLTLITNRGVKVARRSLTTPEFNVDGSGVTDLRTPTDGGIFRHYRTAFSGSGERVSFENTTYTGTTTSQALTEGIPIASIKHKTSADGSNNLFGSLSFYAGKTNSSGTPDTSNPYAEKWRMRFNGNFEPTTDGGTDVGSSSKRVNTIHLVNAPSVTSDETLKTPILPIGDLVLNAWERVGWGEFKLLESIHLKGEEKARKHAGLGAQTIIREFEKDGINALDYAVVRIVNEYDDFQELTGKWHYEVVYTEALALEAALQRRETKRLSDMIKALENK